MVYKVNLSNLNIAYIHIHFCTYTQIDIHIHTVYTCV